MIKKLLITCTFLLIYSVNSKGQNIALDNTFGIANQGYTEFSSTLPAANHLNAAAKTPDGKTVITGYADTGLKHLIVAKVNDTEYETGFGSSGATLPLNSIYWTYNSEGKDIAVQTDGKIIIAGICKFSDGDNLVVVRLNSDGSRDNSFNNNGIVKMRVNSNDSYANTVALQTDGKIVVGGSVRSASFTQGIIMRFNTNGILDTTFGNQGITTISTGNNNDVINDIALQSDGKIVACGENSTYDANDFMTLRLNADGSLDSSFNTNGIALISFSEDVEKATCLTIQSNGKILVGGYGRTEHPSMTYYSTNYCVARYNENGTLDTSFGPDSDGKASFGYYDDDRMNTMHIAGSRIYLGGHSINYNTGRSDFCIIALTSWGTLDTSYNGGQGMYQQDSGFDDYGTCLVPLATHNFLFGTSNNKLSYFKVLTANTRQYNCLQTTSNGSYSLQKSNNKYYCYNISQNVENYQRIGVLKFDQNGIIDTSFGNQGITLFPDQEDGDCEPVIETTFDNKILVAAPYKVYKLNSDGSLDANFANAGILNLPIGIEGFFFEDLVYSSDNTFYVVGHETNGHANFIIYKYNASGSLVATYGNAGKSTISLNHYNYPFKAQLQSDGKLVITGVSGALFPASSYTENLTLARVNTNGTLDTTFGINGISIQNRPGLSTYPFSVKFQNDGKIVAAYDYKPGNFREFTIVRFNSDGILDTTFGDNGIAHTSIGTGNATAYDVTILSNNKFLVCGISTNAQGRQNLTFALYDSNGTLDTSFGTNGVYLDTPDGNSDYKGIGMNLEPDGKITVLAHNYNRLNTNTTLLRYILNTNLGTVDFSDTNGTTYIYPNPIENETKLVYTLKNDTAITLQLFDLQGKLLTTFVSNKNKTSGTHTETLQIPGNIQAGNYLLKISSPEGYNTLRIIKK